MLDEAISVAVEHLQWCRQQGIPPRELLAMIEWYEPVRSGDDLVMAVAKTWLRWRTERLDMAKSKAA